MAAPIYILTNGVQVFPFLHIPLDHDVILILFYFIDHDVITYFIVGVSLLVFCGEVLHLCLSEILTCNFLYCDIFFWFWYYGDGGLKE